MLRKKSCIRIIYQRKLYVNKLCLCSCLPHFCYLDLDLEFVVLSQAKRAVAPFHLQSMDPAANDARDGMSRHSFYQ